MKPVFSELGTTTLSNRIAQQIEEAILCGTIKSGERITADAVARQFRVSHIPVREALKQLEVVGLVVSEPNKGARVVELSKDDVKHIFTVRKALEGLAASLAAARIDKQSKKRLQSLVEKIRAAAKSKDFIEMFAADKKFHQIIWELSGNPFLVKSLSALLLPYFGYMATQGYFRHRAQLSYVPKVHQEILNAIASGNGERAQRVIVDIHSRSMQRMLKE
jgi:DNA-binding GntR family transcriptional regulator